MPYETKDLMSDPFMGTVMLETGPFSSPTSTQLFESRFSINLNFKLEKIDELIQRAWSFWLARAGS
jgi:hypothetical protein